MSIEKRSEMSEVSEKLQDLFTNTRYPPLLSVMATISPSLSIIRFLPESSVMSLVDALCQLSDEAMHNHQVKVSQREREGQCDIMGERGIVLSETYEGKRDTQ